MTETPSSSAGKDATRGLMRADWILLPLLGALTIFLIAASTEFVAGRMFSTLDQSLTTCIVFNDPSTGPRGIPNSTCAYKRAEHTLNEYKFNNCGHPMDTACGPKPPGVYRIVMLGSSYPFGLGVPRDQSFATLLPAQLSRKTGRRVELYNESMYCAASKSVALRFNEALAADPDMILWAMTGWDVKHALDFPCVNSQQSESAVVPEKTYKRLEEAIGRGSIADVAQLVQDRLLDSKTGLLFQHFWYMSQSEYLKAYLSSIGDTATFLREEQDPEWQQRLQAVDVDVAGMEARAKAAHVPFVAVLLPNRAHAAMISMNHWPDGYNPYKFDDDLRAIITAHGGLYIDILPGFRTIANPEQYYFPVDDHPDARGHAIFAKLLTKALTSGAVPELSSVPQKQAALQPLR